MTTPIVNRGQELLQADARSDRHLSRALGVSRTALRKWRAGETVPSDENKKVIQVKLSIALEAWGQLPTNAPARVASTAAASRPAPPAAARPVRAPEPPANEGPHRKPGESFRAAAARRMQWRAAWQARWYAIRRIAPPPPSALDLLAARAAAAT